MHDRYVNPLCTRYAGRTMQHIYSDDNKFSTWRRLWVALAESEQELGLPITDEQIARAARAHHATSTMTTPRRASTRCGTTSWPTCCTYGACCPEAKPILHLGATSCYVGDNTDIILMREALEQIRSLLVNVIQALADFAEAHKAEPDARLHAFSGRAADDRRQARHALDAGSADGSRAAGVSARRNLKLLGCKGTTGTRRELPRPV